MAEKELFNDQHFTSEEQEENQEELSREEQVTSDAKAETSELSLEEKLQKEVAELKDKYVRLYSEFENYRRRTSKERLDLVKTASQDLMAEIIPIIDDFERAFKASENEDNPVKVRDGNQLVFQKLVKILENKGLKPMDDLIGKTFDPDTQEAITQIPSPTEGMKGKVIDVVERGYTLGDKVIRYAKVVTGA
ncbi:nucleotide exchange factor GrpE [Aquiflexum lacus]|uniref:nucleotide exchange factor GrpE n=1 Tax=Aquiflexum lacus TaxID=2483805 RepID=UPI001895954F|nr:nucleotide exchange factor GrpE [Aquiflexum lacus]